MDNMLESMGIVLLTMPQFLKKKNYASIFSFFF